MTGPRTGPGAPPSAPTDKLLDHTYDGIQEYDNPMPRWWLLTFAGTVIFSVIYMFNVGPVGSGKGRIADYDASVAAYKAAHPEPEATLPPEQLAAIVADAGARERGKTVYATNCASCHRADGGGLIGPNLADDAWIHGGTPVDVYRTINLGVLEKGMPNWGKLLKPAQLQEVVAYVVSLQGTNPPNPKPPQGPAQAPAPTP
ncbi:MAG: c-type cytochrome [Gemmatimonadetes bacterium]|nr:c-type cytochrome [Gemmatimonadota bacterium]